MPGRLVEFVNLIRTFLNAIYDCTPPFFSEYFYSASRRKSTVVGDAISLRSANGAVGWGGARIDKFLRFLRRNGNNCRVDRGEQVAAAAAAGDEQYFVTVRGGGGARTTQQVAARGIRATYAITADLDGVSSGRRSALDGRYSGSDTARFPERRRLRRYPTFRRACDVIVTVAHARHGRDNVVMAKRVPGTSVSFGRLDTTRTVDRNRWGEDT